MEIGGSGSNSLKAVDDCYAAIFGTCRSTNRRNRWLRALATNMDEKPV